MAAAVPADPRAADRVEGANVLEVMTVKPLVRGATTVFGIVAALSAAEVSTLEARSDHLHDELESWVLRAAPEARNPDELRGLIRLAYASESIFDAARDMTWMVERGEELHPVVAAAIEASEEVSVESLVEAGSRAEGVTLKQLSLETEAGMFVLAVQRGRRWTYRPKPRFVFQADDRVIAIGPAEGGEELDELVGMERELAQA